MALARQTLTIDFGFGGLDQKTDPKRLVPVKFSEILDYRFTKIGRVEKRRAFGIYGTMSVTASRLLSDGDRLFAIAESTTSPPQVWTIAESGTPISTQQGLNDGSRRTVAAPAGEILARPCGSSSYGSTNITLQCDRADGMDLYCVVSIDPIGSGGLSSGALVELFDIETDALVLSDVITNAKKARVLSHPLRDRDEFVIATAINDTALTFYTVSQTAGLTAGTGSFVSAGASTTTLVDGKFDVWAASTSAAISTSAVVYCVSSQTVGVTLRAINWPTNGFAGNQSVTVINSSDTTSRVAIANSYNRSHTGSVCRVWWHESSNGLKTATYGANAAVVLAPVSVTTTSTTPNALVGCQLADGTAHVYAEYSGSVSTENYTRCWWINSSNTPSSVTGIFSHTGIAIASKAACGPSDMYSQFWGCYPALNQNTLFLLAVSSTSLRGSSTVSTEPRTSTLGRIFHCEAAGALASSCSGVVQNLEYRSGEFSTVALRSMGDTAPLNGIGSLWKLFNVSHRFDRGLIATTGRETYVTGGVLSLLDGASGMIPAGPQLFPILTVSATTGGSMAAGTYAFSGYYEIITRDGKRFRSAPAEPVNVTLTTTQSANVVLRGYQLRDGLGYLTADSVRFIGTRTLVNESNVYYKYTEIAATNGNTFTINSTDADASVSSQLPMYTSGGVIEAWMPSAPIAFATNGRRALCVAGDNPNFVIESRPFSARFGLEFFEDIGRTIASGGDRIYALASYLDRWFAFKENGIFVASGDGADATGQNDTLSEFEQIAFGLGCTEPRSVLVTSVGIVFLSARGFYLIGTDLSPRYIGADVEQTLQSMIVNGYTLVDAHYDPIGAAAEFDGSVNTGGTTGERCVFAFTGGNDFLVLSIVSTAQGADLRWSTDSTGVHCAGISSRGGRLYLSGGSPSEPGSAIVAESNEDSNDEYQSSYDTAIEPAITTAWIGAGSIQGLGRVYKVSTLGQVSGSVTVTVAVGYDFSANWSETHVISTAVMQNGQFEFAPQRTRFDAIRFRITQTSITTAAGYMPTQMQLVVGIKDTANKLPATAKARRT